MPSEFAQDIVNSIFADNNADAIDITKNALNSVTYDLIQQRKLEFARSMGFDLGDTAQDVADEIEDELPQGDDSPEDYEFDDRMPHDPPETIEDEEEEDETNQ